MIATPDDRACLSLVALAFIASMTCCLEAQAQPDGSNMVLLDEVVAVVAGKFQSSVPPQVVTRWDLESECRLESIQRYGEAGVDRPISKSLRVNVLERIIDESIIHREALRLDEAGVDEEAIDGALASLAGNASFDEFEEWLDRAQLSGSQVRRILERRTVADRYVMDNLRLTLALGESEIQASFASMTHPFVGQSLDDVHDGFKEWLLGIKAAKHREKLLAELRSRCRVWIFFDPESVDD